MDNPTLRPSPWRWAVLGSFMGINITIQILWISLSPIAGPAATFYGVDEMAVSVFAMVFMVAFVPLSIPVSWALDRFGFRWPVTFGALLMGGAGVLRGLAGNSYALALAATVAMAVAQPFLLNAWTKVPANWLPPKQRAGAVGLVTIASLVGTAIGQVLPPLLLEARVDIPSQQFWYGVASLASALAFLALARERPAPGYARYDEAARVLMFDGLKNAFQSRGFWISLGIAFVGLGFFNGINTWIEPIIRPRGFSPGDAGTLGAIIIVSGLAGAAVLPALSDREGKRRKYILLGLLGSLPGMAGIAFASNPVLLYASAAELGFFLVSIMPVTMQYVAEATRPTPEGTSNGLFQLFGQGAVVFVYLMGALRNPDGSFSTSLVLIMGLFAACAVLAAWIKDVPNLGAGTPNQPAQAPLYHAVEERVLEHAGSR